MQWGNFTHNSVYLPHSGLYKWMLKIENRLQKESHEILSVECQD